MCKPDWKQGEFVAWSLTIIITFYTRQADKNKHYSKPSPPAHLPFAPFLFVRPQFTAVVTPFAQVVISFVYLASHRRLTFFFLFCLVYSACRLFFRGKIHWPQPVVAKAGLNHCCRIWEQKHSNIVIKYCFFGSLENLANFSIIGLLSKHTTERC